MVDPQRPHSVVVRGARRGAEAGKHEGGGDRQGAEHHRTAFLRQARGRLPGYQKVAVTVKRAERGSSGCTWKPDTPSAGSPGSREV